MRLKKLQNFLPSEDSRNPPILNDFYPYKTIFFKFA